jgi:hypothetical protein
MFSRKHTIALSRDHPLASKKIIHVAKMADWSLSGDASEARAPIPA